MSTLKVNKIRDTSGSADAITFDPNGGAVLAGVTTVSTVKVGSGVTISSDGDVFTTGVTTSSTIKVGAAVTINSDGVVAAGIAVTCGSINGAPIGRKNALINGAFNVWQRGTSVTMLNSAKAMLCDRWTGSIQYQAGRHSRQSLSGAIAGQGGTYCLRAGSSNGTSTRLQAGQYIESINAVPLAGRECTLSFYIKFSAANTTASSGAYGDFLIFSNYYTGVDAASYSTSPASSATHVQITAGSLPTTWTKYTKTFTPPSDMQNMTISFQFSELGQTSSDDDFYYELSNVQLELGSQATPFEHISYGENLSLCQRYYYVVADGRDPSTTLQLSNGYAYATNQVETMIHYPVMRAAPSLTHYTGTGVYSAANANGTITFNSWLSYQTSPRVVLLYQNSNLSANPVTGDSYRMQLANANAYIHLEAEM